MKRKIAISLALKRTPKAVEQLNEYLTVYVAQTPLCL